jgi:tellurite resistance protein
VKGLVKGNYLLIDDNIANVLINKGHSILISPYTGNSEDSELLKLLNFLQEQKDLSDITANIEQLY